MPIQKKRTHKILIQRVDKKSKTEKIGYVGITSDLTSTQLAKKIKKLAEEGAI